MPGRVRRVPHRAETRFVGRHRRQPAHRSDRLTDRGRTVLLSTALGTALMVGVAGGTAAAAAQRHTPLTAPASPAGVPPVLAAAPGSRAFTPSTAEARTLDTVLRVEVTRSGRPVRQKAKPKPKVKLTPKAVTPIVAAWVDPNPTA